MRELKFRVWSEEDREYRTDCDVFRLFHGKTGCPATIYNDEGDRFDIEQYTGLKDKNGKEIYEGDIIFDRKNKVRSKVVWNEGNLWFDNEAEPDEWGLSPYTEMLAQKTAKDFEIIGNIHENPELLEDKK